MTTFLICAVLYIIVGALVLGRCLVAIGVHATPGMARFLLAFATLALWPVAAYMLWLDKRK